ncbi:sulfurtransferase complex subunit TusD [Kineobactrum sediminis]|uniref:Sulfurtransferase complex subunit TusD n=1 Tax=Kineobactrum sediminis TaxID=1905677 RepID=A0A2N5Y195_9GAMM|nr:sulfurtransferase complex subunit TusD [Kineobactrum sediminis]PLW82161.1 sulfurtransferase complex subunit TusD [Kineobactrum sediminis]
MIYSLLVLAAPTSGHASLTAARFAQAVVARGHQLKRVFFLDDGALTGLAGTITPQDEASALAQWQQLGANHEVELILCISSALKRGVLDATEAERYERNTATMHPDFELGGLGLLVEAMQTSDRLITFGQ